MEIKHLPPELNFMLPALERLSLVIMRNQYYIRFEVIEMNGFGRNTKPNTADCGRRFLELSTTIEERKCRYKPSIYVWG